MNSQTLFDSLQKEFCPPLDSSLVAALLADITSDNNNGLGSNSHQLDELRNTLRELSAQADESQLSEFAELHIASSSDDTSSTPDIHYGNTPSTSTSLRSISTDSSQHSFNSPLGFLQAALPHVSSTTLSAALENNTGEEFDMWDIVAGILTHESIREMEERGLDGDFGQEDDELGWEVVGAKRVIPTAPKRVKRNSKRGTTITLVDVRQQQHARPSPKSGASPRPALAPDPWTQLSSLSAHLATLLPPHLPPYFQSYFHSPDHATPYHALCACLESICKSRSVTPTEEHYAMLFNLLDIVLPEYDDLDGEQRTRLISDAELSLQATECRGEDALDLIKLLRDLDTDSTTGFLEMGVYHFSPSPSPAQRSPKVPPRSTPTQPSFQARPPGLKQPPPSPSTPRSKPSQYQWQAVPNRKVYNRKPQPLSAHIPAYTRDVNGIKVRGAGNVYGKGGKGDVGELGQGLQEHRRRVGESMRKRDELLQEASRLWQKGNKKTRGGEVAFYFAERAREFQELAKTEALNAARTMIEAKRLSSPDQSTVDLHGTTVAEAIIIVKEILHSHNSSPAKPLKIITGRGAHSVNHISVLKPAIKKELVEDGWAVRGWDGGLIVHGKRPGRS